MRSKTFMSKINLQSGKLTVENRKKNNTLANSKNEIYLTMIRRCRLTERDKNVVRLSPKIIIADPGVVSNMKAS